DAPACDGHGRDAGVPDHAEDVADLPDIAGTEDKAVRAALHDAPEQVPAARADVLLLHGAGVDGRPGVPEVERGVENPLQIAGHRRRVIEAAPELDGAGDVRWNSVADGLENLEGALGLGEPVPAASLGL